MAPDALLWTLFINYTYEININILKRRKNWFKSDYGY